MLLEKVEEAAQQYESKQTATKRMEITSRESSVISLFNERFGLSIARASFIFKPGHTSMDVVFSVDDVTFKAAKEYTTTSYKFYYGGRRIDNVLQLCEVLRKDA